MSLGRVAAVAAVWSGGARILTQVVQFAVSAALAHLLAPADFGVVGAAVVFTGLAALLADAGLGASLVQAETHSAAETNGVFWLSAGAGLLAASVCWLAAPWVGSAYGSPDVVPIVHGIAPVFLLVGCTRTPQALLQRRMDFFRLAQASVAGALVSSAVALAAAYLGAGAWSLVLLNNVNAAVFGGVVWVASGFVPRLPGRGVALGRHVSFSRDLLAFSILNYGSRNADNFVVGRLFGAEALGYYIRAYGLMLLPINQIISMISEVMFSVMSRMQTDPTRLRTSYVRVLRVIALTSFPLMIGLWVSAEAFVHVVFGPQWDAAIPIIRILAPVGMIQAILNPTGWIYLSLGRTRTRMWVGLVTSAGLVLAIVAGAVITGSVLGMALWYAAGNLVIMVPELVIPGRMIGMQLLDVLLAILAPLLIAVAMGATVWIVDGWWLVGESYAQRLAVDVGLGALVYIGLVVLFRLEAARDLLGIIRRRAPMGSAPA